MKRRIITAIDVGTTKVCTTIASVDEANNMRIIGVGITPSTGLQKGMVVNLKEAADSIRTSVRKAELASGHKVESAFVGVTGRHVTSVNNRGAIAITHGDRRVRNEDLKRVLKCAQNVEVPTERKLIHVIPRAYAIDGQSGVKNPVGMHGLRLDVETHIITATVTSVQNLVKCIRSTGLDVDDLVLEPIASAEAVLTEEEKQAGVILADIGGGTTDIAIFRDGSIWHTAVLPVAGYQLTRDVAIGLGLPFDVAEEMKKRYGSVLSVYDARGKAAEELASDGHGVSYQDLCDIIRARVEEIVRLVMLELPRAEYEKLVPAGLVFTGGSSNISGLESLAHDLTQLPVRVGAPINLPGLTESLRDPAYATVVGMMLWANKQGKKTSWQKSRLNLLGLRNMVTRFTQLFRR